MEQMGEEQRIKKLVGSTGKNGNCTVQLTHPELFDFWQKAVIRYLMANITSSPHVRRATETPPLCYLKQTHDWLNCSGELW
jgi:hypothetical protein